MNSKKGDDRSLPKNDLKKDILITVAREGIAMINSILTATDSTRYAYKIIKQLTEEELICDGSFTVKDGGQKYKVSYKAITAKGLQWLIDNAADEYEWLKYLPQPLPRFSHTRGISNSNLFRNLKTITASIMFSQFGIETMIPIERQFTDTLSYRDMVVTAKNARYKTDNRTITAKNDINNDVYIQSRDIVSSFGLTNEEVNQYAFSKHIGLLISCSSSYFIYCTSQNGLVIQRTGVERARLSAMTFLTNKGLTYERNDTCQCGLILCKNSNEYKHFFDRNYNNIHKEKTLFGKMGFYASFRKLHIVPISRDGMYLIDNILTYKDKLHETVIACIMQISTEFIVSNDRLYELIYDNAPVYIGIDMEQCSLQRVIQKAYETVSESNSQFYWILCYEWQAQYYERIVQDNIKLYTVKNDLLYLCN